MVVLGALPEMVRWQYPQGRNPLRGCGPWVLLGAVLALAAAGAAFTGGLRAAVERFLASNSGAVSAVAAGLLLARGFRWALARRRT